MFGVGEFPSAVKTLPELLPVYGADMVGVCRFTVHCKYFGICEP